MLKELPLTTFAPPKSCPVFDGHQREPETPRAFPLTFSFSWLHSVSVISGYLGKEWHVLSKELMGLGHLMVAV